MKPQEIKNPPSHTVILACSAMSLHVAAAQKTMKTDFPVIEVDSSLHENPSKMRQKIIETLEQMEKSIDTVLAAMGFCGGSGEGIATDKRIVIPRVDDCITLLLHTDDTWYPNLKQCGHLYLRDDIEGKFSPKSIKKNLCSQY